MNKNSPIKTNFRGKKNKSGLLAYLVANIQYVCVQQLEILRCGSLTWITYTKVQSTYFYSVTSMPSLGALIHFSPPQITELYLLLLCYFSLFNVFLHVSQFFFLHSSVHEQMTFCPFLTLPCSSAMVTK